MKVYKQEDIQEIAKVFKNGDIIAFPTETVFGLGVLASKKEYFDRLVKIKNRHPDKPFTLMTSSLKYVEKYLDLSLYSRKLFDKFTPGEVTFIVKAKDDVPSYLTLNTGFIGIRIPNDKFLLELLDEIKEPLLVPSCNPSDLKPATNDEEAIKYFDNQIEGVVMGKSISNKPSTVVKVENNNYSILRHGKISDLDLEEVKIRIAIGSDHGGFDVKSRLINELEKEKIEFVDCGTYSKDSCNYAEFALKVGEKVSSHECDLGILICNSGEGVSIAANKVKGVRCALLYNDDVSHLAKEHNNANCIAFGASFMSYDDILRRVRIFLDSSFEGGRHETRVSTITDYEEK